MRGSYIFMFIVVIVLTTAMNSCSDVKDPYLRTLDLKVDTLYASSEYTLESLELFHPSDFISIDCEWLLLSSSKGDYKLSFINTSTDEIFFAIRKGRAFGEVAQGGSLHKLGSAARYYDYGTGTVIEIDLHKSVASRCLVADTVAVFDKGISRPVYIGSCEDGFISGNAVDLGVWYSLYNIDGEVVSSVSALNYKDLYRSNDHRVSIMLSSKYCPSPDGSKICVANVPFPAISFANVQSFGLIEYKRYEVSPQSKELPPDLTTSFADIHSDHTGFYLLYSGHMIEGDILPGHECNHLIVYDFSGNPIKHYWLDKNISSIQIQENTLIGLTDYPISAIYKFDL